MNKTTSSSTYGIGTVLFLIFLTLKLCKIILWSWWWVFAPIWIPIALMVFLIIIVAKK